MKLLMITGDRSLAEGRRGAFYNTLEEFHKYWDRIDIICPQVQSSKFKVRGLFNNVFIHPSPWPLIFQPWWILKRGRQLYREHKFNLMTVHEYPPFYNGIGAKLLWGKIYIPYVLEIHHIPGYPKAADIKEWAYKIATRCFIKYDTVRAMAVRVVNQHQVPDFLFRAGVPKEKNVYIPSMYIDLEIFKPLSLPKKYDLIFVGRLTKNKGVDLLLEVLMILSKTYNLKPKTLIVGDGPEKESLKFKVKNLKLQDSVIFQGWAEDSKKVSELINESRILVMSSYNEGGPRVALEAIACEVPIITTRVGLMPDIIKDGENGLFIDWNPVNMAEKILLLLNSPELQKKFSQSYLGLVKQFEKKTAIKNYAEKLQKLSLAANFDKQ